LPAHITLSGGKRSRSRGRAAICCSCGEATTSQWGSAGKSDNLTVALTSTSRTLEHAGLTDTRAALPEVRFVLCTPFTLPGGTKKEGYEEWAAQIKRREEIVAKLALKHHAALVRFRPVFDAATKLAPAEHWIWDGIHPTYSGHQLMADEWVRVVQEFWPAGK